MDAAHQRAFARMYRDRSLAAGGGDDFNAMGPPVWDRAAWDRYRAKYGRWPFSYEELPPSFEGAPDWVYELMNIRRPPIEVRPA